jgi:cytochrome c peroxidase
MKTNIVGRTKRPSARSVPRVLGRRAAVTLLILAVGLGGVMFASGPTWGVNPAAPPSLKTIPIPEPPNLGLFLRSDPNNLNPGGFPTPTAAARQAAIALGKALFWDMQVGSDGVQSCATCHFHAGADNRFKNAVDPGLRAVAIDQNGTILLDANGIPIPAGDPFFTVVSPNSALKPSKFPFTQFLDPEDRFSQILFDSNDVVSSAGVHNTQFVGLPVSGAVEVGTIIPDPIFNVGGVNTRRVEPRNAPTVINAVFNYANFWDGRANNIFNGSSPFGDADPDAGVFVNVGGVLQKQRVSIPFASLASQAVGPPGSDFEMSFAGRSFPNIGKKLLALKPLGQQMVHPNDSVLGKMSRAKWKNHKLTGLPGLKRSYAYLIQQAFQDQYWNSASIVSFAASTPKIVNDQGRQLTISAGTATIVDRPAADAALGPNEFTQMEANFSLFFGLAVQMYEATLVSNDTPFDRFQEGNDTAMSPSAQAGLNTFLSDAFEFQNVGGSCINCHAGSEFTNASVSHVGSHPFGDPQPETLIQNMAMGDGGGAFYDDGYYNIGVRPIEDDLGRSATDPFGFPLSFTDRALIIDNGGTLPFTNPLLPCGINQPVPCTQQRSATAGSFKAPGLRNVELTGPFFHNGGAANLMQVLDHYTRGGSFNERNIATLAPDIQTIVGLQHNPVTQNQLVDFLMALTDERVRFERAPFDHPELFIPNGSPKKAKPPQKTCGGVSCDQMLQLPAVGKGGLGALGLPPIQPFMGLNQYQ